MGVLGIGIDLLHIPRFRAVLARRGQAKMVQRILTAKEREEYQTLSEDAHRLRFLGVRWAVKEAAYKALYPSFRLTWKDLSFTREGASPKPILDLESPTSDNPHLKMHASVSHDGEYIIAQVLAEHLP